MENEFMYHIGRRDFIRYSVLMAAALSTPALQGCATSRKNIPSVDYKKPFLIKNANLVDITSGKIVENSWLMIHRGVITKQGIGETHDNHQGFVFDLKGWYLIPGLIDSHCHATMSPVFSMRMMDLLGHATMQKHNFVAAIESGITTIRDMGSFPEMLQALIRSVKKGNLIGPRVVYCNSMLNVMGSHPEIPPSDVNFFARPASVVMGVLMNNFTSTEEMKNCLNENARGASLVKLTLDNQTLFCKKNKEIPFYTKEQLDIIFNFAEKKGLPVSGHHTFKFGFDRAMEYPFNSIEHIVADTVLSDADIMKMAKRKVAIIPTLTVGQSYLMEEAFDDLPARYKTPVIMQELQARKEFFTGEATKYCKPLFHEQNLSALKDYKTIGIENLWEHKKFLVNPEIFFNMINNGYVNLRNMHQAGILIGCGIDAGMPFCYFGSNFREYEIYKRVGFSNIDVLRCATINNAKILGMEDKIGSLDTGKYADMVVLDKNPLDDIRALRTPQMVFKQGAVIVSTSDRCYVSSKTESSQIQPSV